jgi:chromosome partitioning protein
MLLTSYFHNRKEGIMNKIALVNEKGGVGKTPTAINLGYAIARKNRRVLWVDLDPQASLTKYFLDDQYKSLELTMYHALIQGKKIPPVVVTERLHLLPAKNEAVPLVNAEVELPQKYRFDYQKRLEKTIKLYTEYDDIIIDTPGNVSIFTVLALAAANQAIIPVKTERAAEQATDDIMELIQQVQGDSENPGLNPSLSIWGILPTMYEGRVSHHQQVLQILQYKYNSLVYAEPSRKTDAYNKAHALKSDVSELDTELGKYWDRMAESIIQKGR